MLDQSMGKHPGDLGKLPRVHSAKLSRDQFLIPKEVSLAAANPSKARPPCMAPVQLSLGS
jgi:hypothetical protein